MLNLKIKSNMDNPLVKYILKEQSHMRVTLNGGSYELDDATIPFQIGFDESIADLKPTHILVIDVTRNPFTRENDERYYDDSSSERTLFRLEPLHYLQLKKPGIHHLIFILFNEVDKKYRQYLLGNRFSGYNNSIEFCSIEDVILDNQISYAEVVVEVPEEFFAPEPKTKFEKAIYSWVNSWYRLKPVDQCEYRKRKIWAFTLKPVIYLLGFIPRLMLSVFIFVLMLIIRVGSFVFGYQPVSFFPNTKDLWINFLVLYPNIDYGTIITPENWLDDEEEEEIGFYPHKTLVIGEKRIYLPVALSGLIYYTSAIYIYVFIIVGYFSNINNDSVSDSNIASNIANLILVLLLSFSTAFFMVISTLPTIKNDNEWKKKWDKRFISAKKRRKSIALRMSLVLGGIALSSFLVTQISWLNAWEALSALLLLLMYLILPIFAVVVVSYFAFKLLIPLFNKILPGLNKWIPSRKEIREQDHLHWLKESFDIDNLPKRVDFSSIPASSGIVHRFRINFWRVKAKVCKPYAK